MSDILGSHVSSTHALSVAVLTADKGKRGVMRLDQVVLAAKAAASTAAGQAYHCPAVAQLPMILQGLVKAQTPISPLLQYHIIQAYQRRQHALHP